MPGNAGGRIPPAVSTTSSARTTFRSTPSSGRRSFMQRSFEATVPEHTTDAEVRSRITAARSAVEEQLDKVHLRSGLREALNLARFGNEWFDRQAPWKQVREDRAAADQTMGSLLDLINAAKLLFAPFLPHTSAALHGMLGYTDTLEEAGWRIERVT